MLIGENDWRRYFSYRGAVQFDISPVHRNAWIITANSSIKLKLAGITTASTLLMQINLQIDNFTADYPNICTLPIT